MDQRTFLEAYMTNKDLLLILETFKERLRGRDLTIERVFCALYKNRHPGMLHCSFFHQESWHCYLFWMRGKPSPGRIVIKPLSTFDKGLVKNYRGGGAGGPGHLEIWVIKNP